MTTVGLVRYIQPFRKMTRDEAKRILERIKKRQLEEESERGPVEDVFVSPEQLREWARLGIVDESGKLLRPPRR